MKILLLEDDLELCKNIKNSLEKENYMVDCCNDGETAMLYALNTDYAYDIAIVDRVSCNLSLSDSQFDGYFTKDIAYISSYLAFRLYRCYRSNPLSTEKVVCSNGTNTEKPKRFCCNSVP